MRPARVPGDGGGRGGAPHRGHWAHRRLRDRRRHRGHRAVAARGVRDAGCRCGGRGAGSAGRAGRPGAPRDLAEIVARALAGDPPCQAAVTKAGIAIGSLVGAVATPLDLDCVVVGGTLARAGTLLPEAVRAHLTLYVGRLHPATVAVLAAELGDDAPLRGALLQARHTSLARSGGPSRS
ncbi:ROK family protein [Streptodolium elevatio]